ncbi:hypothetical protein [Microvirga alba]|uniref:hypothetical protein n=1 Tax=Microvirga alba TaxID=2791025 RepID=UPI001AEDEFA2|nr:hypothetical protein [Microvirga alba]
MARVRWLILGFGARVQSPAIVTVAVVLRKPVDDGQLYHQPDNVRPHQVKHLLAA